MSNALAIAATTWVLKDLLNDGLINGDIEHVIGSNVKVTAQPPDRVAEGLNGGDPPQINLFLHRVTPNAALRNCDLPTRDAENRLVQRPLLAVDLHFLLTVYASEELHSEILLGYAMETIHETPTLQRTRIRSALSGAAIAGATLPPPYDQLSLSGLAEQFELIKLTPTVLSMDDMSKLWSALNSAYRTTVAYEASVVLIQREQPVRRAPPVLTRGGQMQLSDPETGTVVQLERDEGVNVSASLTPTTPLLLSAQSPQGVGIGRIGDEITIQGSGFDAGPPRPPANVAPPPMNIPPDITAVLTSVADDPQLRVSLGAANGATVSFTIGDDPAAENWRVGVYLLSLEFAYGPSLARHTNSMPMAILPLIESVSAVRAGATVTFNLEIAPPLRPGQSIGVTVGDIEMLAQPVAAVTTSISVSDTGFSAGDRLPVRVRVDNIESLAADRSIRPPAFASTVDIP